MLNGIKNRFPARFITNHIKDKHKSCTFYISPQQHQSITIL